MPMTVTCTGCGKKLNVRDELAGKKLRCPGCGATFEAKAAAAARTAPAKNSTTGDGTPKFSISWGFILMILGALAIPALVLVWLFGPIAVKKEWDAKASEAHDTVVDVLSYALKAEMSRSGGWDASKPGSDPKVDDPTFVFNVFVMSMPEAVQFQGASSVGQYLGKYHPSTGEVEADLDIGGGVTLFGKVKEGSRKIHVTGRSSNGKVEAEVDGKKATIYFRPKDEE